MTQYDKKPDETVLSKKINVNIMKILLDIEINQYSA